MPRGRRPDAAEAGVFGGHVLHGLIVGQFAREPAPRYVAKDGAADGGNEGDDDGTEMGAGVGVTGVGRLDGCGDTDGFAVGAGEMIDGVVNGNSYSENNNVS